MTDFSSFGSSNDSSFVAAPDDPLAFLNNEPGLADSTPTFIPGQSSDLPSIFGDLGIGSSNTPYNFYPPQPDPNASGPNIAVIGGQKYVVTPDNYTDVARLYIQDQQANGSTQYGNDYAGQQSTIAAINAMRELAGLAPTWGTINTSTGQITNPVIDTANSFLNNPIVSASNSISNAGTAIAQGTSQGVQDVAGLFGGLGNFFKVPGNLLIVAGLAIGAYVYFKVKK